MDRDRFEELARDPRFIPGIYNYCDQWCQRCPLTWRCLNYAMTEEAERSDAQSRDATNKAFWDRLSQVFETTGEMIDEQIEQMEFEFDEDEFEEYARQDEEIRDAVRSQPFSQLALKYIDVVDQWFKLHEGLTDNEGTARESLAAAEIADTIPADSDATIPDWLEVLRWHQPQIWVKLCRAASGAIRADVDDEEVFQKDANGSAKVAIIGIERSIAAWATLLRRFPDHEDPILALAILKRLLRQTEAAFPKARSFLRPGFDTTEESS